MPATGRGVLGVYYLLENIIHYYYCQYEGGGRQQSSGRRFPPSPPPPPLGNTLHSNIQHIVIMLVCIIMCHSVDTGTCMYIRMILRQSMLWHTPCSCVGENFNGFLVNLSRVCDAKRFSCSLEVNGKHLHTSKIETSSDMVNIPLRYNKLSQLLAGRCYGAKICAILLLLRCPFRWNPFSPMSKFQILAENHGL